MDFWFDLPPLWKEVSFQPPITKISAVRCFSSLYVVANELALWLSAVVEGNSLSASDYKTFRCPMLFAPVAFDYIYGSKGYVVYCYFRLLSSVVVALSFSQAAKDPVAGTHVQVARL